MRILLVATALATVVAGTPALAQTLQWLCQARFSDGRIDTVLIVTENGSVVLTQPLDLRRDEIQLEGCAVVFSSPQADL